MSFVKLGKNFRTNQLVAMKSALNEDFEHYLGQEIGNLEKLDHPNIIKLLESEL